MASPFPNIVFILADDLGAWALGCSGNEEVHTPHLDRLAQRGIRLSNAFCVSPVCTPARASLMTGSIPSQHGLHDWIKRGNSPGESSDHAIISYLEGQTTYTELLASYGYRVGLSGKWHLGNAPQPQKGHTFWEVHARGGGPYYGAPMIRNGQEYTEPRYITDVITENALNFLRHQDGTQPFYLGVHYTAPHSPWDRQSHPDAYFTPYFDHCAFASTPDLPPHPWQIGTAPVGHTPELRREYLSGYYAAITAMDAQIGRLFEELKRAGTLEETLIIFTGDNGMNMGHHGIWGKGNGTYPQNMYDTSVKVPFIISCPSHLPQGRVSEALFSHYDFFPSLFGMIGRDDDVPAGLPGVNRSSIWEDALSEDATEEPEIIIFDEYGPVHMIRTAQWKYVHRYPAGPCELYHLKEDPDETCNLIHAPEHIKTAEALRKRMTEWFERYADPNFDGRNLPVSGRGQLDRLDSHTRPLFD